METKNKRGIIKTCKNGIGERDEAWLFAATQVVKIFRGLR
jgi:hypothetical protein